MLIWVFDKDFTRLGAISTYKSLQWTEDYRGVGQLELHYSDTNDPNDEDNKRVLALLKEDNYLFQTDKRTAMKISYIERNTEDMVLIVYGHTTLDLLSRRIVFPQRSVRGNIEASIYDLIRKNATDTTEDRGNVELLELAASQGLAGNHDAEYLGEELTDAIQELAQAGDLGYFMKFDHVGKRHLFSVYQGKDLTHGNGINPPAVFSDAFGNLMQSIIINDWTMFKNVAYVGGEIIDGQQRVFVTLGNATGLDRREVFIDASSLRSEYRDDAGNEIILTPAQYRNVLTHFGWKGLSELSKRETFMGEIGNLDDWGSKYYLGDKVTCLSNHYMLRIDGRIIRYTEITENNHRKLSVTFGDPEITGWRI